MSKKNIIKITIGTVLILLIPLVLTIRDGGIDGVGWNWTLGDFIVMGFLLFCTGLTIDFAVRKLANPVYRYLAVAGILVTLFLVWVELAVDGISKLMHFLFSS